MKVSQLDQYPERKEELAQLLADGVKHADIADVFGVHVDTIGDWKKRPDVQAKVSKIIENRANSILAHTDTSILKRLEQARDSGKSLPIEILLQIRKTFAGEKLTVDSKGDKAGAMQELMRELHEHPDLAAAFGAVGADDGDDPSD